MTIKRSLASIDAAPEQPGFLGPEHKARQVVGGSFSKTDPFIFLMDDVLDKKTAGPVGSAHPHAGFETVSLLLEGEIGDEAHTMQSGDFQIMTAGSGIVHAETIEKKMKMRLLQLWLSLPGKDRWTKPRVQDLPLDHVPVIREEGVTIRLYSGELAGVNSPVQNYSPLIVADINLKPGRSTIQQLPADYNTFLYVLEGEVGVGEEAKRLKLHQTGWLDSPEETVSSELKIIAGDTGARLVLYAGKPTGDPIISHGPFIGDSSEDISRLYQQYRKGEMQHIANVPKDQRILL